MEAMLLDAAGHRCAPVTMPGYRRWRPSRNKGEQYPADPPTVEEIIGVMRAVGDRPEAHRLRALIVLLPRVHTADRAMASGSGAEYRPSDLGLPLVGVVSVEEAD
jgi:hypothetical protein